jgi:hypothetical protein
MVIAGFFTGTSSAFRHAQSNENSGGKATHELSDFLRKGNAGPEHHALWQMIGGLLD